MVKLSDAQIEERRIVSLLLLLFRLFRLFQAYHDAIANTSTVHAFVGGGHFSDAQ